MNDYESRYESWGRYPKASHSVKPLFWRGDALPFDAAGRPVLPYGRGRSYGDVCLNDGGILLDTSGLRHFMALDRHQGVLRCEPGVTFDEILRVIVPLGWFVPVSPGTRFLTVGGAIANDIHGKNHHRRGAFGRFVTSFELLRSDGRRITCSPTENAEWFRATIGGLGLTGLITWAEFRLIPVAGPLIETETRRFRDLDEFFALSANSETTHEYSVAWVDCLARGSALGRGLFFRGNHAPTGATSPATAARPPGHWRVPIDAPAFLLNAWTIRAFNAAYFHRHGRGASKRLEHFIRFFYPLDAIEDWNRIYGRRGFLQYQCVVPLTGDQRPTREILRAVSRAGRGSFLAVLKAFGDLPSPGLLSFPRKGVTLALDFPNAGAKTFSLLDRLDAIVREHGGAVYPAKDARMSAASFQAFYPRWREFAPFVDPGFSSSFWRRVTA